MVKDASVVHPRRAEWSQLLSSVLNIECVLRNRPVVRTDTWGWRFDPRLLAKKRRKKTASARGLLRWKQIGTKTTRAVSLLFRWSARGGSGFRGGRSWRGFLSGAPRRRRRHAGLRVVGLDDRLGDVHHRHRHNHRGPRPRLRRVEEDAVAVVDNIFLDDGRHFRQDFISDLALLGLEIFLRVLSSAIETLLFCLDLLHQLVARFFVQLILLGTELLIEAVDFVGQALQLVLFGFKLFGERFEIAPSFVGLEEGLFDVDGTDLGARSFGRCRSGSGGGVGYGGSGGCAGRWRGLGQREEGEAENDGQGDACKLADH